MKMSEIRWISKRDELDCLLVYGFWAFGSCQLDLCALLSITDGGSRVFDTQKKYASYGWNDDNHFGQRVELWPEDLTILELRVDTCH